MNTKTTGIVLAVLLVALTGSIVYLQTREESAPVAVEQDTGSTSPVTNTTGAPTQTTQTQPAQTDSYTAAEVATHKDATSCWTIIAGAVYDLTQWIPQHPGGEQAILGLCGRDGTEAFLGQHEGGKKQADTLVTFKIGTLAQ